MNKQPVWLPDTNLRFRIADQISISQVSKSSDEFLGFAVDDFSSGAVSFVDRIHADDRDIARTVFLSQTTDTQLTCNLRLRQASGRICCFKATYQRHPLANEGGFDLELLLQDARSLARTTQDASATVNFRAMMEATDDYIYFKDRNHVFTGASQTLVALCDPAEHWTDLLGKTDYDVFPEALADIYYRLEKEVFAGTSVAHEIQRTLTKDGRSGWVDNRKYPVRDASGEMVGLYGIARDITERILSEEALLHSEKRFRALYESMTEGVALHEMVFDPAGRPEDYILIDVNPAFESILGLHREDVVGRKASAVYGQVPYLDLYADVAATGEARHFEVKSAPLNKILAISASSSGTNQFATVFDDITQRKQAEEALHDSNEKFRAISETASDAIVMIDNDSNVVYWNAAAQSTFGYTSEEALGRDLHDLIAPDSFREAHRKGLEHFQKTGQGGAVGKTLELVAKRKDDTEFPLELSFNVMQIGGGWGAVGIARDISSRRAAEEALGIQGDILGNMAEGVHLVRASDGVIVFANSQLDRMFGYEKGELLGKHVSVLNAPGDSDAQAIAKEIMAELGQSGLWSGEVKNIRKDASVLWCHANVTTYEHQRLGRVWVSVHEDVTRQKLAEEKIRKLSLAVEQSPESIAITNLEAKIEYVNDAFVKATGYSREEAIGQNPSVLHSGKTLPETYAAMWAALTQGLPWTGEFLNRRKDGSEYTELATITPLRQADGKVSHYVAVKEDITQRKQIAEELERHRGHLEELVTSRTMDLSLAKEAAEAASRSKSAFLATMSHELRTPMNGIMGMTDLALRLATDPKQQEYLGRATQASKHLLAIINDILDMAKIEAGRFELNVNDFKLGSIVSDLTNLVSPQALQKGLKLQVDLEPRLAEMGLRGDALRVRQILLNLLGNAIKFTAEGSILLQAMVAEESEADVLLRFSVSDTGIGISAEDQMRLFAPFQQVDTSLTRGFGGTGLGLAICKRLAEAMGGSVGLESQMGVGSTFWFTVRLDIVEPVLASTTPICPDSAPLPADVVLKNRFAGSRILLVEDEPISQEIGQYLLEEVGLSVDVADDGVQAVQKATESIYALILMDMQMPNLNGLDATRAIRALPGRGDTPIVAMTANAFDEDRQRCLEAGMTDFMAKPVRPDVLYETVLRGLQRSES